MPSSQRQGLGASAVTRQETAAPAPAKDVDQTGFVFQCPNCGSPLRVSAEDLAVCDSAACARCHASVLVPNASGLVVAIASARNALQTLRQVMNECPVQNTAVILNDVTLRSRRKAPSATCAD